METSSIDLEVRLQARCQTLVAQHSARLSPLAAGLRALPDGGSVFAATQAGLGCCQNPKVTLPSLCQPLQEQVRTQVAAEEYVLIAHDWSWLDYQ